MAISERKRREYLTRTLSGLILAAVVIPAYFVQGGTYLYWVLRFGFVMSYIELCAMIYTGNSPAGMKPLVVVAGITLTWAIFFALLICYLKLDELPVELIGGCIFTCVMTDVVAYFAGHKFGGQLFTKHSHPFPKISPNKTTEGFLFGLLGGVIFAFLWFLFVRGSDKPVPFWRLLVAVPTGMVGDLLESALKRFYGAKDANDALINKPVLGLLEKPLGGRNGHGGYFDRLDSLVLALLVQSLIS